MSFIGLAPYLRKKPAACPQAFLIVKSRKSHEKVDQSRTGSRRGPGPGRAVIFIGYPDLSVFPTHEQARRHLGVKPDFVVAFRVVSMYH